MSNRKKLLLQGFCEIEGPLAQFIQQPRIKSKNEDQE